MPSVPLDIDLARGAVPRESLPARFRRARVLARWSGVPVGMVEVSVRDGQVSPADVLQALQREHRHALPREAVRRALLTTGVPDRLDVASVWETAGQPRVSSPGISVVVCTRDRPTDLAACLDSLMRLDPRPFETIVVDNAPATDATRRLVREQFPSVHYVCEPHPGLDHARNRGIAEANGDIIAFTDDDAVADPAWVESIAQAFAADPAVGLVTGLVEPLELETKAQILFERYGGFGRGCRRMYSQVPRSGTMPWTLAGAGQLGAGVNMAFRRDVFARIGLFDPALDVGTPTLGGGDHDIFYRVLRAGYLCVYEPTAVVRHRHRRTMKELRNLFFGYGQGTRCFFEREAANFPPDRPALARLRRWWWRHWAWKRWWQAAFRPPLLPASLVVSEIKGFVLGRGAYAKARARIVSDELARPDAERQPLTPPSTPLPDLRQIRSVGIAVVDAEKPLQALDQAASFAVMEIVVRWHGRPLGTVRVASSGQSLSARRLADEISHALWHRLLEPQGANVAGAFIRLGLDFVARMPAQPVPAGAPEARGATVVVTTCDRPDELQRCLQSLAELRTGRPVQIVVVDNRPASGAAAAVVREFPGVELVLENRRGSSYARNAGIAAARGEFIAMVDDDMRVEPDWLERLLAPFSRADVMAVTGNTPPARLETHAERMLEVYGGFGRGFFVRDFDSQWFHRWRWRSVPTWQIGGSGNAAFRREIFSRRDIGRFAETLGAGVPTGVGEDTKLFYDILHAGFTIVYEPAAVAWHYHRVTMAGLRKQLYAYSKGHVAYHLTTLFDHGDGRALVRIFAELPLAFFQRARERLRGRCPYPWSLLFVEMAGTLAGPWSLWRAHRLAKQLDRRTCRSRSWARTGAHQLMARKRPALEGQP